MKPHDFIGYEELLSNILVNTGDEGLKKGLTKGFYMQRIRLSLKELSFDTFFEESFVDIKLEDHKDKRGVIVPFGIYDIINLYLFNGSFCSVNESVPVHYKRNFISKGLKSGYTASRTRSAESIYSSYNSGESLNYASEFDGFLNLSDNCFTYEFLRIVYKGSGSAAGEYEDIPSFFREAIIDKVCYQIFALLYTRTRDIVYRESAAIYKRNMDGDRVNVGSWKKAERRVKSMNRWERDALSQYLKRPNI